MIKLLDKHIYNKEILDAGCAGGWYTEKFISMGAKVTAIDVSETMIKITKERTCNKADVLNLDLNNELPGWYTEKFISMGAKVTAIDVSETMIKITKERTCNKADVLNLDLNNELPFKDNKFDIVVSSLTLHYIKDLKKTFSEFKRILKPNGILLFSVHHPCMDIKDFEDENYFITKLYKEKWEKGVLFSVHHPCMDIKDFEDENYFITKLYKEKWEKGGVVVDVQFFHRPLQEIINTTTKYFNLECLVEPTPEESFKEKDLDNYNYLSKNPHFLIIKS